MKEILYIKGSQGIKEVLPLSQYNTLGSGGEAQVYKIDSARALKVFKEPDHPDIAGQQDEEKAAEEKIKLMQEKLPKFPQNLPKRVIAPKDLVIDERDTIFGYTMRYLDGANELKSYDKSFRRKAGLSDEKANEIVLAIFRDLHHTITEIHESDVVIGDLSDDNVLVKEKKAYIIDADSFLFDKYQSGMFKPDFLDPKLIDPQEEDVEMKKGAVQTTDSDWYAYTTMLAQGLLLIHPYRGVYTPNTRITKKERLVERINIFNEESKEKLKLPADIQIDKLPDDLLQYFEDVFSKKKDKRGEFPVYLLDMRGSKHTGSTRKEIVERGEVKAEKIFEHNLGFIKSSTYQKKQLRYLYHEGNNCYKREDGSVLLRSEYNPKFNFEIQGKNTIVKNATNNGEISDFFYDPQDEIKISPHKDTLKTNSDATYYISNRMLWRKDKSGNITNSDYLKGNPAFWVGEDFGIVAEKSPKGIKPEFVFDARDLNRTQRIGNSKEIEGQLVDSACYFDKDYSWLLTSMKEGQDTMNHCMVINQRGEIVKSVKTKAGNDTWLGNIHRKCAAGNSLLTPTDNGVKKTTLDLKSKELNSKTYPETAAFVNSRSKLLRGKNEIYAVNSQDIVKLEFKESIIDNYLAEASLFMLLQDKANAAREVIDKTHQGEPGRPEAQRYLLELYVINTDIKKGLERILDIELRWTPDVCIPDKYAGLYNEEVRKFIEKKSITELLKKKAEAEIKAGGISNTSYELSYITAFLNYRKKELELLARQLDKNATIQNNSAKEIKEWLENLPTDEAEKKGIWMKDATEFIEKYKRAFVGTKELERQKKEASGLDEAKKKILGLELKE